MRTARTTSDSESELALHMSWPASVVPGAPAASVWRPSVSTPETLTPEEDDQRYIFGLCNNVQTLARPCDPSYSELNQLKALTGAKIVSRRAMKSKDKRYNLLTRYDPLKD